MRGRDSFKQHKTKIMFLVKCFRLMPKFFRNWIWNRANYRAGKIGLLLRYCVVKTEAKACGDNVMIGRGVEIIHIDRLEIGSNVSIHKDCYIDAGGGIIIKDDVSIAHQTSLLSFNHGIIESIKFRESPNEYGEINIDNDVWIGAGCRILSGVSINKRVIVAAGAVVNKNVGSNLVVGGVPAKILKKVR